MDRGAWRATVHGVAKGWTQLKQLSTYAHKSSFCRLHTLDVQVTKSIMLLLSSFSALQGIEDTSNMSVLSW